jgi:hypothetical protein
MVLVLILNLMNGALVLIMAWQEFILVGKLFRCFNNCIDHLVQ